MVLETLFYSWAIIIIKFVVTNDAIGIRSIVSAILPISYNEYWFISAYMGMYILSPAINLFALGLTRKQFTGVLIILVAYLSLWNTVIPYSQPMGIHRFGQSVLWFIVLYLIAAYIRLYADAYHGKKVVVTFCVSILFINLTWLSLSLLGIAIGIKLSGVFTDYFYHYNSLPVLIASVSLFIWFKRLNIKRNSFKIMISIASPLCFGVYLIHDNPNMRDFIWNRLNAMTDNTIVYPIVVAIYGTIVFIACLVIDFFRSQLFAIVNQREEYKKVLAKADNYLYVIYDKLYCSLRRF